MQNSFGLQITDLAAISSGFEQELTLEDAKKIVGGISFNKAFNKSCSNDPPIDDFFPNCPKPQNLILLLKQGTSS